MGVSLVWWRMRVAIHLHTSGRLLLSMVIQ
jgi:hypothetical protein